MHDRLNGGCTLSHKTDVDDNKINSTLVDGSGGDCDSYDRSDFREKGRQALTRPSYDRTRYPVSGSLVGCLGSLLGKGVEQRSTTETPASSDFDRASLPGLGRPLRHRTSCGRRKPGPSLKVFEMVPQPLARVGTMREGCTGWCEVCRHSLFLCCYGSSDDTACLNEKTLSSVCVFPLGSGAGEIY